MRLLIIEDDVKTAKFIQLGFQQLGYNSVIANDGATGLSLALTEPFDIAIIDIMLPQLDGLTVVSKIRGAGKKVPIIVLSARNSVEDKVEGLEKGADDYLAKPYSLAELIARVQALLRRQSKSAEQTELKVDDLVLNLITHKVERAGQRIELQPLEYQLLEYLMRNTGRVVSRLTIMEHVWGYDFDPHTNVVESRVCRLRDKLNSQSSRQLIRTVRGFGYVLE